MITIILPTYNEKDNLTPLINAIFDVLNKNLLQGYVLIVDDNSPDGTGKIADDISKKNNMVNVFHRSSKQGLSSAVVEGFKHAKGEIIGVMDADLSHPPEVIPKLIQPIIDGEAEFVIASRYIKNEKIKDWTLNRKIISWVATILARPLTNVSDPMSGFFFFKKKILDGAELSPIGYKIMLEIIVKGNYSNIKEIPFTFKDRYKGESKLNWKEHFNYVHHLFKLYIYTIKKLTS